MESEQQAHSDPSMNERDHAHGHHSGESLNMDKEQRIALLKQSREGLVSRLSEVVSSALGTMGQEMTSLAHQKSDQDEQRTLSDAASLVERNSSIIQAQFKGQFSKLFDRYLFNTRLEPLDGEDKELALVDDSFMRDKLKRDRLVQLTAKKLDSEEVLGLRARLAALIEREWFDENKHPAAPEVIYEALQNCIDKLGDNGASRSIVLAAFEPSISANLNGIYATVNTFLRERDVLPRIKPRVSINPDTGRSGQLIADVDANAESSGEADDGVIKDTIVLPPPGPARDAILAALASQVAEGAANARSSAVRMLSEVKNFEDDEQNSPDDELIDALNSLQGDTGAEGIRTKGALQTLGDQMRAGAGSPLDQLTLEIVSLIFDFLSDDPRIPSAVKNQLLRLQVVGVKAALLDRSFFASRQHPMRRLIDRTTELSCDPDTDAGDDSQFVGGLRELISGILGEFDRDLDVFAKAVDKLAELEAQENRRREESLSELTSNAQQTESLAVAQEEAVKALDVRMDDMTPAFVREFLLDFWSQVLVKLRLDPQVDDERWTQHLKMAEQLIWSVLPKTPASINLMAPLLPRTIGGINKGLALLSIPMASHDRFFNELMKWHTKIVVAAKAKAKVDFAAQSVSVQEDGSLAFAKLAKAGETAPTDSLDAKQEPLDQFVKGQLLELMEPGKAVMRVKLAFISPARKLYALSRFPDFARSFQRAEMVAMLDSGRLAKAKVEATVDRAIKAVGTDEDQLKPVATDPAANKALELQQAFAASCADNAPA